ncbi:MAG: twin-arginine translocase subunit TatC [Planctomycetota bacterium]
MADEQKKESGDDLARMSFGEHLEELRWRLFKSIVALLVTFVACFFFYKPLVVFMVRPHLAAMELLNHAPEESKLLAFAYTDPFFATLKLSFIVGFFVASPFILYQMWAFIAAGLYRRERHHVGRFAIPSFVLFVGGCAFGYYVLIPYGLWGLTQIQILDVTAPVFAFSKYLNLVMLLTIVMGIVFELPLVMLFLAKTGLVDPAVFSKWRKIALVLMFVTAAMLTPPDVFTQLIMAGPLILLYELGVILAKIAAPKKEKAA